MSHYNDCIANPPATVIPVTSDTMDHPVAGANADTIYLEVGRTTYSIKRETLAKFEFFRKLMLTPLSNMFNIDANQEVFPHIIAYLRRGTYPLAIDAEGRHDIPTYLAILEEARYFKLERLSDWIEKGLYEEAAKTTSTTTLRPETEFGIVGYPTSVKAAITPGGKITSTISKEFFPGWGKKLVYHCPRDKHNGKREECGKQCHNALGGKPAGFDEVPMLRLLEVKKKLVIDPQLCRDKEW